MRVTRNYMYTCTLCIHECTGCSCGVVCEKFAICVEMYIDSKPLPAGNLVLGYILLFKCCAACTGA